MCVKRNENLIFSSLISCFVISCKFKFCVFFVGSVLVCVCGLELMMGWKSPFFLSSLLCCSSHSPLKNTIKTSFIQHQHSEPFLIPRLIFVISVCFNSTANGCDFHKRRKRDSPSHNRKGCDGGVAIPRLERMRSDEQQSPVSPGDTLLLFDFDCTLSSVHLFHSLRSSDGQTEYKKDKAVFLEKIWGGKKRMTQISSFLGKLNDNGFKIFVLSFGNENEIEEALLLQSVSNMYLGYMVMLLTESMVFKLRIPNYK